MIAGMARSYGNGEIFMKGWKTWAAAAALAVLGIIDIVNNDVQEGVEKLTGAMALVGLGHKLEKGFNPQSSGN